MTTEPLDVNISSSVNVTDAETGTVRVRPVAPQVMIVRVTIILILAVINLCGNGFTLITIRMTPRLRTKTNFILASMLLSTIVTGVFSLWYAPYLLVVIVFNRPCRYNVLTAALTPLMKISGYISTYHVIPVSVERYIAIICPLHYETRFTDRTLKWAIFAVWAAGIFMGVTHWLWLIDADHAKCTIVPDEYYLIDVLLVYTPVCVCLFTCYGRILAVSWHLRRRIEPQSTNANRASGPSLQTTQSSQATTTDNTADPDGKPVTGTGARSEPAVTSGATSAELTHEQQRQKVKSRRREFKAVYLTAAIVGTFVVLRFPYVLGHILTSAGHNQVVVSYLSVVGGAFNLSSTWAVYAAVSKSYRRAYRQTLIRIGCCCCKNVTLPADNSVVV